MTSLNKLQDVSRERKKRRRVGRGIGSGLGKTCGRGEKGAGSRSGYKRRLGYEGGQFRLFMKLPIRGFSNARFSNKYETVNLGQLNEMYSDGETVNAQTLAEKGFFRGKSRGIKILGDGELNKKVKIEVKAVSSAAQEKLQKAKIAIEIV
ncbi:MULTISPECIES: 50S ribosomal protein L15 [unclassified Neochlamydia]|uniref:50S ribosomal protein L15 n=1 Tax=unclassified Neochlamydia TaxID=2643326 RepID=UPI00140C396D|nr:MULTISPECIES: 50S ribosomal protein L15 [unclassified Neochlamydia]MBS4165556.1 50S ribosomal protein L15 [Neochlamydia sp. AcF65]MBS4169607.1 50S ribosomal protein L15 [Neochlamydia sp. AcF95]NGY94437.1 50S ribosomal protein L15 [Neochlamydia sp. AcF84]